ncbi:hypothetical protein EVAR_89634_1 [Eumeta japonica]|uniref:Uncharacterized protein n=1 Tax=Eumeta variegata TaxID=151549 RepID=A0A4C1Z9T4_EUMVA|nr:hypothetical protein EVAR_89634_1 [Eumeta japonica]
MRKEKCSGSSSETPMKIKQARCTPGLTPSGIRAFRLRSPSARGAADAAHASSFHPNGKSGPIYDRKARRMRNAHCGRLGRPTGGISSSGLKGSVSVAYADIEKYYCRSGPVN